LRDDTTQAGISGTKQDVSEILQLLEIKDLLIALGLCHQNGIMERWNAGLRLGENIGGKGGNKPF